MKIPLSKEFKYETFQLTEIDLPLNDITPGMYIAASREMGRRGIVVPMNKIDPAFQIIIASKLTKIPEAVLNQLPYEDWDAVTGAVQYFLMQSREPETELDPDMISELENPVEIASSSKLSGK